MEPEKFENNIKKVLREREMQPSPHSWEKLEQRLGKKETKKRPYLLWLTSVAAVAVVFFVLGTFFNSPIASEEPAVVEQTPEASILQEKVREPEVIQLATSEAKPEMENSETAKKPSAERPAKNVILESTVGKTSKGDNLLASDISSEVPEETTYAAGLLAEVEAEIAAQNSSAEVKDSEIEALLLLAGAELESNTTFMVNSKDLLHQVEYELDQSFRQKVFEVVKEGFSKAKTAVANRDF